MFSNSTFRTTYVIFILITVMLFIIKPMLFFGTKGNIKKFGFKQNEEETPIPLDVFIYGIMILCYIVLMYIDHFLLTK